MPLRAGEARKVPLGLSDDRLDLEHVGQCPSIKSLAANLLPGATPTILPHRWDVESTRAGGAAVACRAMMAAASLRRYLGCWWPEPLRWQLAGTAGPLSSGWQEVATAN